MTRFDSGFGCTRRRVVKALGLAGVGALTARDFLTAQAPKRGKIDVHSHTYPLGQANGKAASWKPETTIEAMDKYGISVSMLSAINGSRDPFYSGKPEAAAAVRASNEYHSKLVQQYPKRFGFFANVPINDIDGSLKEIEYAMDTLKADGMAMWTSTPDKKYPGNDMYKPIMEELNRRKVAVFIHPADPWCCRNIDPPVPDIMGEYDFDVTRAGESLLLHGTFESSPDIKFIFVHSGGAIPMLAGRIRDRVKQGKREDLEPKVFDLLRKQYYDIAHASFPFPFGALRNFVPNSQILFGTDFPAQAIASTTDPIPTLGISAANLQAIYNGNALRLFPRLKALLS